MLKVGDKLPAGSLQEFIEVEGNGCSLGPNSFDIAKATAGKTIALFALPGAYTPLGLEDGAVEIEGSFGVAGEIEVSADARHGG